MRGLQPTNLLAEPYLLQSFLRDFSRSLSAHPIQPLPPEIPQATALASSRQRGKTARF